MNISPSLEEFQRLAADYKLIPVYTELPADMETPISLYLKLVGDEQGFMLESADSGRNFGRYSFIGLRPFAEIIGRPGQSEIITAHGGQTIVKGKPLAILRNFLPDFFVRDLPGLPPFFGGGVGYFAYDIIATWERVRGYQIPDDWEVMHLLFCRLLIVMDHLRHTLQVVYLAPAAGEESAAQSYQEAVQAIARVVETIRTGRLRLPDDSIYLSAAGDRSGPGQDAEKDGRYTAMVAKAKDYIAAGDAFQIVISEDFTMPVSRHPFNLYRHLRRLNPSPYMFYLNFGDKKIVGASPEMLVKVDGRKVYTCPIAGTCPRGADDQDDERLAAGLLADVKERAEHAMLVDLGRNDLGRISIPGTVTVERFMQVEKFSHVMHLVSLVSGELDPKYTALDVLEACFPAGTVSGAPKVRAMEIIHELEGDCRGAYAGAVGYLDFRGNMDTCITIRTMVIEGSSAAVRVGAGIVYDSVPDKEYQEVLHKGRALFKLLTEEEET